MKCHHVDARDIPDAWFQMVDLCYQYGRDYQVGEGSYAGSQLRRELDYITCHIRQPWAQPLLPDIPEQYGIPNPVPEGMDYIYRYLPYLMSSEKQPGEQYTYGERLFGHIRPRKISQVDQTINLLKRSFRTNQASMSIAQPSDSCLSDPPCLRSIDCRINEGEEKLHFIINFRSWDLWGGFPANLAALVFLQEYMSAEIEVQPGEFICSSKGLHLYDMYWDLARIRLGEK